MTDGACRCCGRPPGPYHVEISIDGQLISSSPGAWVYAHRDGGVEVGMCDQCFTAGRLEGLTPDEVEYFRRGFARCTEDENDV